MSSEEKKEVSIASKAVPLLAFLDLEATGFRARTDEVTQIGTVVLDETANKTYEFSRHIKPLTRRIHPVAAALTGLTHEYLQTCEPFSIVFCLWKQWLAKIANGRSVEIVAHNGFRFDFVMLFAEIRRHGIASDREAMTGLFCADLNVLSLHDMLIISKRTNPTMARHTLAHVWRWALDKGEEEKIKDAHDALADCWAMLNIYRSKKLSLSPVYGVPIGVWIDKMLSKPTDTKRSMKMEKKKSPADTIKTTENVPTFSEPILDTATIEKAANFFEQFRYRATSGKT